MNQCPAAVAVPALAGGALALWAAGVGAPGAAPRRALISQAATAAMPTRGMATRRIRPGRGPGFGGSGATRLRWVVAIGESARAGREGA